LLVFMVATVTKKVVGVFVRFRALQRSIRSTKLGDLELTFRRNSMRRRIGAGSSGPILLSST
jgi:hypothetical protein